MQSNYPQNVKALRDQYEIAENQNIFYFCIWGVRDSYGTSWVKGCFSKSIRERGPNSQANQKIVACWQHDICDPIGRPLQIVEDEIGAYALVEWDDPDAVPNAKRAMSQIRSGTLNGYSFGFDYIWDKMEYDEERDVILIREVDLFEVSPVTFASIEETFTVRSKEDFETKKMILDEDMKEFIKSLPRGKQMELRQLFHRLTALNKTQPDDSRSLEKGEPQNGVLDVAGFKINLKQL